MRPWPAASLKWRSSAVTNTAAFDRYGAVQGVDDLRIGQSGDPASGVMRRVRMQDRQFKVAKICYVFVNRLWTQPCKNRGDLRKPVRRL
jgi:hypothetical protein